MNRIALPKVNYSVFILAIVNMRDNIRSIHNDAFNQLISKQENVKIMSTDRHRSLNKYKKARLSLRDS